jgi:nucleoside-diphosphate-sugar epimerase
MLLYEGIKITTRITVCNYDSYQEQVNTKETKGKRKVNTKETQATPKQECKEGEEGKALSPYAVTKQLNEQYAGVYAKLHEIQTIGLRYFNVFGPYQNPNGVYAAAIPKFLSAVLTGGKIIVNGDGEQTRDFTYVQNAVLANLLGLTTDNQAAFGSVFNVACGKRLTLNEVISGIVAGVQSHNYQPTHTLEFGPKRMGDIPHSLASIAHIQKELNYFVFYTFEEGLATYLAHSLHD